MNVSPPASNSQEAITTSLRRNLAKVERWSSVVQVYSTSSANAAFTVIHDLGVVPDRVRTLPWGDTRIWATEDDRRLWTATLVVLHSSAASTKVDVMVGTLQ